MNTITASHVIDIGDASPHVERRRLGRAVTQWSVTKAEWIKLRSVRANVVGVAAAAVASSVLASAAGEGGGNPVRRKGGMPLPVVNNTACPGNSAVSRSGTGAPFSPITAKP